LHPFYLNHGSHGLTPLSSVVPKRSAVNNVPSVSEFVGDFQSALNSAKSNISSSQQRQKTYADQYRRKHTFQVGDSVLLAVRRNQLPPGYSSKLSAKYMGPFPIVAAIGNNVFKLDLPATVNIHPVFHVSQLKPYEPSTTSTGITNPGPVYADTRGEFYVVEKIVAKNRAGRSWKFLVKWKGWEDFNNSWEPLGNIRHLSDLIAAAPEVS
jgi:Chromo (CHRromatin Organisation MOdifier) domain